MALKFPVVDLQEFARVEKLRLEIGFAGPMGRLKTDTPVCAIK
jgi:hypothetical protein